MSVLLDTQCWLWMQAEPERFSRAALDVVEDPGTTGLPIVHDHAV